MSGVWKRFEEKDVRWWNAAIRCRLSAVRFPMKEIIRLSDDCPLPATVILNEVKDIGT